MENLYLAHHGVKGMKWGVRRYQNPDGSLKNNRTSKRYARKQIKYINKLDKKKAIEAGNVYDYVSSGERNNRRLENLRYRQSKNDKGSDRYNEIQSKINAIASQNKRIAELGNRHIQNISDIDKKTNKIIKQLDSLGYSVGRKDKVRNLRSNGRLLMGALIGGYIDVSNTVGTKYYINNKKRSHIKSETKEKGKNAAKKVASYGVKKLDDANKKLIEEAKEGLKTPLEKEKERMRRRNREQNI